MERDETIMCMILTQVRDGARLLADLSVEGYDRSTISNYVQHLVRESYLTSPDGRRGFEDLEGLDLTDKGFEFIGSHCL